jgi:hypothetical protein
VVIAVTTLDRPAAAPQTGDFDLGYHVIAYPTFVAGITATATIFVSSAGTSAFLPVISEMRQPRIIEKLFLHAWVSSPLRISAWRLLCINGAGNG